MLSGSGRPGLQLLPPPPAAPAPRPPPRRRRPSSAPALAPAGSPGPDRGGSEEPARRARLGKAVSARPGASPARTGSLQGHGGLGNYETFQGTVGRNVNVHILEIPGERGMLEKAVGIPSLSGQRGRGSHDSDVDIPKLLVYLEEQ
ncbi:hypothetical protein STEG23_001984 [Scotinomys teguina]